MSLTADWMERGSCNGTNPDIWFPEQGQPVRRQKAICATCTVRAECLAFALENGMDAGIWGGTTARERRRLRRARNAEKRAS